jgi:hypothetical protein
MPKDWNWTVDLGTGSGHASFQPATKPSAYPYDAGFLSDASEAYRKARAGRYSIWIVSPPGYSHSRCFEEVALGLQSAFLELGYRVPVVADPAISSGKVVVLGPHLLSHVDQSNWPAEMILFNLEQVSENSSWMTGDYRERLRRHMVWDYSPGNIQALQHMGISNVTLCPIGYASNLSRIRPAQPQDIDVLFIGSINQRRRQILNNLQAAGIDVRWGFDIYGRERDNYFARAKLVLNMHMYDAKVFEIVRVSYLLANRVCVVSETGADPELENKFKDGVAFADVDELAETCQRLLGNPDARRMLQDEGFRIISALPQRDFLQAALEESESRG